MVTSFLEKPNSADLEHNNVAWTSEGTFTAAVAYCKALWVASWGTLALAMQFLEPPYRVPCGR